MEHWATRKEGIFVKWKKYTLTTTTDAVDLISSSFNEIGIEGIEIEDHIPLTEKETKGMFIDILPELPFLMFIREDTIPPWAMMISC